MDAAGFTVPTGVREVVNHLAGCDASLGAYFPHLVATLIRLHPYRQDQPVHLEEQHTVAAPRSPAMQPQTTVYVQQQPIADQHRVPFLFFLLLRIPCFYSHPYFHSQVAVSANAPGIYGQAQMGQPVQVQTVTYVQQPPPQQTVTYTTYPPQPTTVVRSTYSVVIILHPSLVSRM